MALPRKKGQYVKYLRAKANKPIPRSTWHRWHSQQRISSEELAELGIYRSKRRWKGNNSNCCRPHRSAGYHSVVHEGESEQGGTDFDHPAVVGGEAATSSAAEQEDLRDNFSIVSSLSGIPSDNFTSISSEMPSLHECDGDTDSVTECDVEFTTMSSSASNKAEADIRFSEHIGFEVLNQPLTSSISTTKFEALLMILHIALRFGFTQDFLNYQIKFVNKLLGVHALTESCYFFQKLFMFSSSPEIHFYCPDCSVYLGTATSFPDTVNCEKCRLWCKSSSSNNGGFYFITLSVRKQMENLLSRKDIEFVSKEPSADDHVLSDIKDGKLYKELFKNEAVSSDALTITFNSDGCPVYNSGPNALWPIQYIVNELQPLQRFDSENVLLAGLWFGKHDPVMSVFFKPFVDELKELSCSGIVWERPNGQVVESPVYAVCCCTDSVARPKVQNLISFNGCFGCGYCLHPNTKFTVIIPEAERTGNDQNEPTFRYRKIMRYLEDDTIYNLRTDKNLREHMDLAEQSHHEHIYGAKGKSVLHTLPNFNLVYGFPVDYMHAVLLGVVKRLANLWFDSTSHMEDYYIGRKVHEVDERIQNICVTSKMRYTSPMSERVHWKARMWRDFLLYYGLPCLVNILLDKYYVHFKKLCTAIYSLLQESVTYNDVNEANALLKEFVFEYQDLYGEVNMVYNTHLLTHLAKVVSKLGPLWAYSLFPFESGNGRLLKLVKGTRGVATQIGKKYIMTGTVEKLLRNDYNSSDSVLEFCGDIFGYKYSKHVSRLQSVVLFEKGTTMDFSNEQLSVMETHGISLTEKALVFKKALVKGTLYKSRKLSRQLRKNDSCIQLCDGTFKIIEHIVKFSVQSDSVLCFVRSINIASDQPTALPAHLKLCSIDPYGGLELIGPNQILAKSLFISCNTENYVSKICNRYEKE